MNIDSPKIKTCVGQLKEIDFELAYLATLTGEGLKPSSRWEKPLNNHGLELLQQIGLLTKQIQRNDSIKEIEQKSKRIDAGFTYKSPFFCQPSN